MRRTGSEVYAQVTVIMFGIRDTEKLLITILIYCSYIFKEIIVFIYTSQRLLNEFCI